MIEINGCFYRLNIASNPLENIRPEFWTEFRPSQECPDFAWNFGLIALSSRIDKYEG